MSQLILTIAFETKPQPSTDQSSTSYEWGKEVPVPIQGHELDGPELDRLINKDQFTCFERQHIQIKLASEMDGVPWSTCIIAGADYVRNTPGLLKEHCRVLMAWERRFREAAKPA